jgi:hypothetical protein
MSCGLGAIILVFMLVKHNIDNAVLETDLLEQDLKRLETEGSALRATITDAQKLEKEIADQANAISREIADKQRALNQIQASVSAEQAAKKSLEEGIKSFVVPKSPDIIEKPKVGEEQYLIGLKVEGKRIAILIDSSASMTDEKLIDIIRRKNTNAVEKQRGPKWQRTVAVADWLVARLPESSQVTLVSFKDTAISLTGNNWISGKDANGLTQALAALQRIVPEGPTNLEAGLRAVRKMNPTDVYLVTDGLPTDGDSSYKSLNPFSDCSALWGGSAKISGICRIKLFEYTVKTNDLGGARVNVVLLPIEGDPDAANEYWRWTSATRGILISPAQEWP